MNFKKYVLFIAFSALVFPVNAAWVSSKIDRVQSLPNGNIAFWLTSTPAGQCGASDKPLRAEVGQFGVDINGVKTFSSILLTAIVSQNNLDMSVRDEVCRIDSLTIHN